MQGPAASHSEMLQVYKRKARNCHSEPFNTKEYEMDGTQLVALSALALLWLNGSVDVNINISLSFGAMALILLVFLKR